MFIFIFLNIPLSGDGCESECEKEKFVHFDWI